MKKKTSPLPEGLYKKRYVERLQEDEEAEKAIDEYLTQEEENIDDTTEQISNDIRE